VGIETNLIKKYCYFTEGASTRTTKLLRGLFDVGGNRFRATDNPGMIASYLHPKLLGQIIGKVLKGEKRNLKDVVFKDQIFKDLDKKILRKLKNDFNNTFLNPLMDSLKECGYIADNKVKQIYPAYFTFNILYSFAYLKYTSRQDIANFFAGLKKELGDKIEIPKINDTWLNDRYIEGDADPKIFAQTKKSDEIDRDYEKLLFTALYLNYKQKGLPPIAAYTNILLRCDGTSVTFPDCFENTIRMLTNFIAYDVQTDSFDSKKLGGAADRNLKSFYQKNSSAMENDIDRQETRSAYVIDVLQGIQYSVWRSIIAKDTGEIYDLEDNKRCTAFIFIDTPDTVPDDNKTKDVFEITINKKVYNLPIITFGNQCYAVIDKNLRDKVCTLNLRSMVRNIVVVMLHLLGISFDEPMNKLFFKENFVTDYFTELCERLGWTIQESNNCGPQSNFDEPEDFNIYIQTESDSQFDIQVEYEFHGQINSRVQGRVPTEAEGTFSNPCAQFLKQEKDSLKRMLFTQLLVAMAQSEKIPVDAKDYVMQFYKFLCLNLLQDSDKLAVIGEFCQKGYLDIKDLGMRLLFRILFKNLVNRLGVVIGDWNQQNTLIEKIKNCLDNTFVIEVVGEHLVQSKAFDLIGDLLISPVFKEIKEKNLWFRKAIDAACAGVRFQQGLLLKEAHELFYRLYEWGQGLDEAVQVSKEVLESGIFGEGKEDEQWVEKILNDAQDRKKELESKKA
ncbi:MAG: hypothetical protein JW725_00350, partial [Candidatus Babeliaceae bacterium]|nr:hypothetical protein [Candidatus Babeliaceae bacterium]